MAVLRTRLRTTPAARQCTDSQASQPESQHAEAAGLRHAGGWRRQRGRIGERPVQDVLILPPGAGATGEADIRGIGSEQRTDVDRVADPLEWSAFRRISQGDIELTGGSIVGD